MQLKHFKRMSAGCLAAFVLMAASTGLAAEGTVNTKALVLRKSASKSSKALQTLAKGDSLNILSASGDWYKVTYGKYTGYVMKKYVKASGKIEEAADSTVTSREETALTTSGLSTLRPGNKGNQVKKLQQALREKGLYTGKIDGVYGSGTTAAVKAYQKQRGLTRDGIAGKKTLTALYGDASEKENSKTESLEWFGHENTIPKGAKVTIKDVYTGKTFNAVRWSGASHMDTQPASREDTTTMKAIYGGSWSWRRRPILVQYNGHVYAASMNGMPHGTSTIDNGFDGHFCIHFTGSKTHGTDKVDSDHQSCVQTALKSSW